MTKQFLNPYTFIPAFPREDLPEPLRDGQPPGHDRLSPDPDRWTGRIGVTLTVETPLLLLDTVRGVRPDKGDPDHVVYPVLERNGRPHLPATGIKGALRAAFEAITNSRMGVFRGHGQRLGYRRPVSDGLQVEPVVISRDRRVIPMRAARLLRYPGQGKEGEAVTYEDGSTPGHGDGVAAVLCDGQVRRLVQRRHLDVLRRAEGPDAQIVTGFLYITGQNTATKKYERLFYRLNDDPEGHQLTEKEWHTLIVQWESLIRNYREAHDKADIMRRPKPGGGVADPAEWLGDEPGMTAWSPHLYEHLQRKEDPYLPPRPPLLCWARYRKQGRERKIAALYPVMVSRDVHPAVPEILLDDSLHPASAVDQLSPADRVFGWVAQKATGRRPAAYRGRLRIGPVTCDQDSEQAVRTFDGDGLPLAILGRPRPEQGAFYLSKNRRRPDEPIEPGTKPEDMYKETHGLRGRKAYPHHAALPAAYWDKPDGSEEDSTQVPIKGRYREFRRPRKPADDEGTLTADASGYRTTTEEQRDSQNRSVRGWIKPGTVFRFTIDVRDLNREELGALAWLLALPEGHFHRLGLGKPLGFGSVRLEVDHARTELSSGEQWAAYYRSLTAPLATAADSVRTLASAAATYTALLDDSPQLATVRDTFLAAARGNPDLPVHYPRMRPAGLASATTPPDPRGNGYEWFTQNQRSGRKPFTLPTLDARARQLEVYSAEDKEEEQSRSRQKSSNQKSSNGSRSRRGKRRGRKR